MTTVLTTTGRDRCHRSWQLFADTVSPNELCRVVEPWRSVEVRSTSRPVEVDQVLIEQPRRIESALDSTIQIDESWITGSVDVGLLGHSRDRHEKRDAVPESCGQGCRRHRVFKSEGDILFWGKTAAEDGYDFVEWAAEQSWSNGKFAFTGNSQLSIMQWFIAAERPRISPQSLRGRRSSTCTATTYSSVGFVTPSSTTPSSRRRTERGVSRTCPPWPSAIRPSTSTGRRRWPTSKRWTCPPMSWVAGPILCTPVGHRGPGKGCGPNTGGYVYTTRWSGPTTTRTRRCTTCADSSIAT
uniref:CocE/NonD family hydrolase n=1 Tax=Gordonia westfalica TaxID=158898 RepID=UPI0035C7DB52